MKKSVQLLNAVTIVSFLKNLALSITNTSPLLNATFMSISMSCIIPSVSFSTPVFEHLVHRHCLELVICHSLIGFLRFTGSVFFGRCRSASLNREIRIGSKVLLAAEFSFLPVERLEFNTSIGVHLEATSSNLV